MKYIKSILYTQEQTSFSTSNSITLKCALEKQKDLFIHIYIPKFVPLSNISHAKW